MSGSLNLQGKKGEWILCILPKDRNKQKRQAEIYCNSFVTSDSQVLQLQYLDTFKEINASCCEFLLISMLNVHSFKEAAEYSGFCSENSNLRKLMKSFKGFVVDF